MQFEWDHDKARTNLLKHGVDFETAKTVFLDAAALIELDDTQPDEERWRIIGLAATKVVLVVFTELDDDVIRIISARKTTRREERAYFGRTAP